MAASMLLMPVQITHQTAANEPQKTPAKQQSKTKTSPKKKQREPKLAAV
jgi:hypothetical protein